MEQPVPQHCVGVDGLEDGVRFILMKGAAWSTQARWTTTQRKFLWFCSLKGVSSAVPTKPVLLMLYCAWLVKCGHTSASITQYVDGVRVLNANFGHEHPWKECAYVAARFKRGLKAVTLSEMKEKLPLRGDMVRRLVNATRLSWLAWRLCAVIVIGYVMGIRIGHLVPPSNNNAPHLLRSKHVTFQSRQGQLLAARVVLPSTKTSTRPIERWLFAQKDKSVCAVQWLWWLMTSVQNRCAETPLVVYGPCGGHAAHTWNRTAFNRQLKSELMLLGEKPDRYSGISLRKGCLTDLTLAGCSPLAVARHADHNSLNSQLAYVKCDEELLASNGHKLAELLTGKALHDLAKP